MNEWMDGWMEGCALEKIENPKKQRIMQDLLSQ
jgi:hypothetical protein